MKFKFFAILMIVITIWSCSKKSYLNKIEGKRIAISDSLTSDNTIEDFIAPYRKNINKDLDSVISYSVDTYTKSDGELNTAIGNLMADIVYEQANPIFEKRTGNSIDFVLLNHGGIRSILSKGDVTKRTAFEIMPFENEIVVVTLPGEQVSELVTYLSKAKRAHPISKLQLEVDKDYNILKSDLNGMPLDFEKTYHVATNDYLYNGGDGMDFFKTNRGIAVLNYKIRNSLIDYFMKTDTLSPTIDDRFIKIHNQ